jgi:hypothetical protein
VLGLSTVHVNRVIQQLRADGLVTWSEKRIVIEDWTRLQEVAEFDPTFLNLDNEPRYSATIWMESATIRLVICCRGRTMIVAPRHRCKRFLDCRCGRQSG